MRVHSIEKIEKLRLLRKKGFSINEIVTELSIPKTTVWHHIQRIRVLPEYAALLKAKRGGSTERFAKRVEEAQKYARELLQGPYREEVIALAMLYWGEGHKKICEFTNSDGSMIKLYLQVLRTAFRIPEKAIKPTMRIFTGMDRDECLSYWSDITKIPKRNFKIRFNDGGTRGRTRYGLCRISVRKGSQTLKVFHALIYEIRQEILKLPS